MMQGKIRGGKPHAISVLLLTVICMMSLRSVLAADPDLLHRGIRDERKLDLFGARDCFREALKENPQQPGLVEHTAWFLYLNGFHDNECLGLLEKTRSVSTSTHAVDMAIIQLKREMGLAPAIRSEYIPPKKLTTHASDLPERLQNARELFWSGEPVESEKAYEALLAELTDEPSLHLEIARVEIAQHEYSKVGAHLKTARSLRPSEPEIALEQANLQALEGNRSAALSSIKGVAIPDDWTLHLARARAYHYAGEFPDASREYRATLATNPYLEEAAYGLTETTLRTGAVPEARQLLSTWPARSVADDWSDRIELERKIAAPRVEVLGDFFLNSITYQTFDAGIEARFRPFDPLELTLSTTHGWFSQNGFTTINRQTGGLALVYQPSEFWALSGFIGVNSYSSGWTSVNGGVGVMLRPFSTLKLDFRADHLDVVDSEPPFGMSIYDLAATIGGVGSRSTMDMGSVAATWNPLERVDVYGKFRAASITSGNTLTDFYLSAAYNILRVPKLRVGYGIYNERLLFPAPLYRQGNNTTSAYYDPENLIVQNFFAEWSQSLGKHWEYGVEGHFYQQPRNGGVGAAAFTYLKYSWLENQAVRLDARVFDQNRGLNRDGSSSGSYSAINLVLSYEYSF